jgi:hypothetical protein
MNYNVQLHHLRSVNPTCLFSCIAEDAILFEMTSPYFIPCAKCTRTRMFNDNFCTWLRKNNTINKNVYIKCSVHDPLFISTMQH